MVVKSATKKKLMDMGVDEEYAHQLSYDRKYDAVRVLSPRNILTILFGAKTWNDEVYDSHHIQSSKKPHLTQSFPLTTPQLDRLTPTGVKHLEIVNDIYMKIHEIEIVEKYREERSGVPFGIINHPRLFIYEIYEYIFAQTYADRGWDIHPQKCRIYSNKKGHFSSDMPHNKHREQQAKLFNRYTDEQGRQQQY
jgi:hypothetical protein